MVDLSATTTTHNNEVAKVTCGTSVGEIVFEFYEQWSPNGYRRATELFERGFYDHSHFFRTVPDFLVQFGMSYTSDVSLKQYAETTIQDDPQQQPPIPFTVGTVSYAGSGPNSRTSQLFISFMKNGGSFGTQLWETPIGQIVSGMDNVYKFYSGYGDMPPWGNGPIQHKIRTEGVVYMEENFPLLDRFLECHVVRRQGPDSTATTTKKDIIRDAPVRHHMVPPHHVKVHEPEPPLDGEPHHSIRAVTPTTGAHHRKEQEGHHNHHHHGGGGDGHVPPKKLHSADAADNMMVDSSQQHKVAGELHHQHSVHFNAAPNEEGLTKLSWELVASCLLLFIGVLLLWLRIALRPPTKSRKTS